MADRFQILVGGPQTEWPSPLVAGHLTGRWAAADRGALCLLELGYQPELVVGDFDSMSVNEREHVLSQIPKVVKKPDQNQTDLELLLTTLNEQYDLEHIDIYGATGGRLDQLFSNIWILTNPKLQMLLEKVTVIDRWNEINFFRPGEHVIQKNPTMTYLGFMPLTPVENLNIVDEKYVLRNWSGNPFSWSSNEFDGTINHFSFEKGIVAVIQSRDVTTNSL